MSGSPAPPMPGPTGPASVPALAAAAEAAFARRDLPAALGALAALHAAGAGAHCGVLLGRWCAALDPRSEEFLNLSLQRAALLTALGDPAAALRAYEALATTRPERAEVHLSLGAARLAQGDAAGALADFERALTRQEAYARAHCNRGRALVELGRPDEALGAFERALALQPRYPEASTNYGVALARLGRTAEAIRAQRAALADKPGLRAARINLANALLAGDPAAAAAEYETALAAAPADAATWRLLAEARHRQHDAEGELAALSRAQALEPGEVATTQRLAKRLCAASRAAEAVALLERALLTTPGEPSLRAELARALTDAGDLNRAIVLFEALLDEPGHPPRLRLDYCRALMRLHEERGQRANLELAANELETLLGLLPSDYDTRVTYGIVLERLDRLVEAEAAFDAAMAFAPDGHAWARFKRWDMRLMLGDWSTHAEDVEWLRARLDAGQSGVEPHFVTRVIDNARRQQLASRLQIGDAARLATRAPHRPRAGGAGHALRVGYLSPDFGDHPVAHAIVELLECHDRRWVHVSALSLGRVGEAPITARLRRAVDEFHELQFGSYLDADAWLRGREFDVLVDLAGHTRGCRPLYLARHPARVQVLYLGYPGTMGAPWLDYVLADRYVIPADEAACYDERVAWLPGSFFPSDTSGERPPTRDTRAAHGLPAEATVFCNFLARGRLTPEAFSLWLDVLEAVPGSVLWLAAERPEVETRLRAAVAARGLDPGRLVFAGRVASRALHLARHRHADLWLDSYPYGAHSTARDALWMGLPVLTRRGQGFPSRVAGSLLSALGRTELIATDRADFVAIATRLGRDRAELTALGERLEVARKEADFFDTQLLARHIEDAYAVMVEREARGLAPVSFAVNRRPTAD